MITYHLGTHCVQVKKSGGEANVGNCTNIIMYGNHIQLSKSKPCSSLGACDLGLTCATLSTRERREENIGAHSMVQEATKQTGPSDSESSHGRTNALSTS